MPSAAAKSSGCSSARQADVPPRPFTVGLVGRSAVALFLALALSAPGALGVPVNGEAAGPVPEGKPVPPTSEAIAVEEVARRAAEVPNLLRVLTESLRPSAQIEAIGERLAEVRQEIDRDLAAAAIILQGQPTLDVLQAQQQLWQRRQLQTAGWLNTLTQRATLLQDALNQVAAMQRTWDRTREAARTTGAPAPILEQIDVALAEIRAAETPLAAQRTAILDLQAAVAHEVARSGTTLAQFSQAQERAIGGVFVRDSTPLWSAEAWARARTAVPARAREVAAGRWTDVSRYVRDPSSGMPWHVAFLAVVTLLLAAVRRRLREMASAPQGAPAATAVLERPFGAAVVLAFVVVASPGSPVPPTVRGLFGVLALGPVIALTGVAANPRLAPAIYALWALFALDNLRDTVAGTPVLEQAILMLEVVAGMAVLGYSLRRGGLRIASPARDETGALAVLRLGAGLVMLSFAGALVASALGYMRLARLLASGVLGSGALALALDAAVQVIGGLMSFALRVEPLRRLQMVQRHRDLLERRAHRIVIALASVGWVARTLDYVGLFWPTLSLASTVLSARLGRGPIQISIGNILEFALTVWVAHLASAFIRFVLSEDVYPRTGITRGISYAISSLLNYVIIAVGFMLALGALGLDLTKVTVLAGAFGVGIGFGLQSVVNNFVSGLILLFEQPIHVGDIVEVGNLSGEVVRIGIRASIVRTGNGAEMIVPNAQLVTERVTNWTLSDRTRRIDLCVGVDYASPPEKVVEVLEAVARAHPQIMQSPAPRAVFTAFGDSSINFELRAWTNRFDRWPTIRTELAAAVYGALPAAGMTFPFPQREVRLLRENPAGTVDPSAVSPNPADAGDGAPPSGGERR